MDVRRRDKGPRTRIARAVAVRLPPLDQEYRLVWATNLLLLVLDTADNDRRWAFYLSPYLL